MQQITGKKAKLLNINLQEVIDKNTNQPIPSINFQKGKIKGKIVLCECWYKGHGFNPVRKEITVPYNGFFVKMNMREPKNGSYYTPSDREKENFRAKLMADEVVQELIN